MTSETPTFGIEAAPVHERLRLEDLQYLAGVFNASGSITIEKSKTNHGSGLSYTLRLDLEKESPGISQSFRDAFPSYSGIRPLSKTGRSVHRWYAKSGRAMDILETLEPHLKIKKAQVALARAFRETVGNRTHSETEGFKAMLQELNNNPFHTTTGPLEIPYLAGLFDCHGRVSFNSHTEGHSPLPYRSLTASISIGCEPILKQIAEQFEGSAWYRETNYREGIVQMHSEKAMVFLARLLPFLRSKRELAEVGIEFQSQRKPPFTRNGRWKRVEVEQEFERRLKEASVKIRK